MIFKEFISLDSKYDKTCLHFFQRDFVHFCLQERKKTKLFQIDREKRALLRKTSELYVKIYYSFNNFYNKEGFLQV